MGSFRVVLDGLIITIVLGSIFLMLQINEYRSCMYNISDGAYPSIFYMLTGLHGSHVFVGLI
jgi:heme/copper-type cytochrome/quinol oxidase subunit 3